MAWTLNSASTYLQREFICAIIAVVYIPPSAAADVMCDDIGSVTVRSQTQHPKDFISGIYWLFLEIALSLTLTTFCEIVTCPITVLPV